MYQYQEAVKSYFLNPGYIFVSTENYNINTILGSCISVCIWDEELMLGGMNHFVYPSKAGAKSARYGDISTNHLIKLMLYNGSSIKSMKAHIVGGASNIDMNKVIADGNIKTASIILKSAGIKIAEFITGGHKGRKVIFNNHSGELSVYEKSSVKGTNHNE